MRKVGAITIGQSPRTDVIPEMRPFFGGDVDILEAGALDGLTPDEIQALAPCGGSDLLVSRLRDGGWVHLEEQKLLPLLQERITCLEQRGAQAIVLLCTGKFPEVFTAGVPILYPQKLMYAVAPLLSAHGHLGIVNPDPDQLTQSKANWSAVTRKLTAVSANPYEESTPGLEQAARVLLEAGADLLVLDCIGYTLAMKRALHKLTGKPVLLPRTLLARLVGEMLGE